MRELSVISKNLVGEDVESVLEKAYCTIIFTSNYVIKLFCRNKREYDVIALNYEYLWDKSMPLLSAKLVEGIILNGLDISALILKRLPYYSNMLYKLYYNDIKNEEIFKIENIAKKMMQNYPKIKIDSEKLYKNYISNLTLQIEKLNGGICLELVAKLKKLCSNCVILDIFKEVGKSNSATLVHGNLFSGNIFYYQDELIIIDPISYNHVARKSFPHIDMATFLVDIRILKNDKDYWDIYKNMIYAMPECEVLIIQLYLVLKLLVRLRFAYMEEKLHNDYSEVNINKIIIARAEKIAIKEMENLINAVNNFFNL